MDTPYPYNRKIAGSKALHFYGVEVVVEGDGDDGDYLPPYHYNFLEGGSDTIRESEYAFLV